MVVSKDTAVLFISVLFTIAVEIMISVRNSIEMTIDGQGICTVGKAVSFKGPWENRMRCIPFAVECGCR